MNRRTFLAASAAVAVDLMLPTKTKAPRPARGIPARGEAGDAFWTNVRATSGTPVVTVDGLDVTHRCRAYDLVAGTVECFVLDGGGRFVDLFDCNGVAVDARRKTLRGKVDVRWR